MAASNKSSFAALTIGAIGVVYGDIGTSPLYAFQQVFVAGHVGVTPENIYGILSLIFWTLTVIVSLKYVVLVLRADNNGEGGTAALLAKASHAVRDRPRLRRRLLALGMFGAALFYGDGVITPAISVLSAVEGLEIVSPHLKEYVVPLTLVILFLLFVVQKRGTADIGKFFGPVMILWMAAIALLGLIQIAAHPAVLLALNPYYALRFIVVDPGIAFLILGAVILCVTGAEALYADLGHFGKRPIRYGWFCIVMPALVLNYFGQGALVLKDPKAVANPFYLLAPKWALLPMVALATLATVIASQALISGAFSATKQIAQLGYLPRMRVLHTSVKETGQIYLPLVNWALFVAIVLAVMLFKSSEALGAAYGIAVTGTMIITTALTYYVVRYEWKYPLLLCIVATGSFFVVDLAFLSSNLLKIMEGGWFPLLIATAIFIVMVTWKQGRRMLKATLAKDAIDLPSFLEAVFVNPPARVAGTAVFMTAEPGRVPNAMLHNLKHNKVLHEQNLFVTVRSHEVPWIGMNKRLEIDSLGHNCWQIAVHYGFKNDQDLPRALEQTRGRGCDVDPMSTSYFLSREIVVPTMGAGMAPWRQKLFAQMHHAASGAADFLNLPNNSVVELGSKIEM
ncbi:MAG: potassium transporter Kup [Proteobacteria bacterium]|nr:potassium transporter Kup [Pseudomonadota bacterium]